MHGRMNDAEPECLIAVSHEGWHTFFELSFLDRLSLLVGQLWNWRENQALGRRLKRDPNADARISLDRNARKCVRARTNGCGQEFCGLRPDPKTCRDGSVSALSGDFHHNWIERTGAGLRRSTEHN